MGLLEAAFIRKLPRCPSSKLNRAFFILQTAEPLPTY
jgi:hypothetical protein